MRSTKRLSSVQSGVAGEYLVAGELSRRGYITSLTLKNTKGIDVLVSNAEATKMVTIQVKTSYGKSTDWIMGQKSEDSVSPNFFYIFTNLNFGG